MARANVNTIAPFVPVALLSIQPHRSVLTLFRLHTIPNGQSDTGWPVVLMMIDDGGKLMVMGTCRETKLDPARWRRGAAGGRRVDVQSNLLRCCHVIFPYPHIFFSSPLPPFFSLSSPPSSLFNQLIASVQYAHHRRSIALVHSFVCPSYSLDG